jgi:predicted FMN-binding regulatory protein PaiB
VHVTGKFELINDSNKVINEMSKFVNYFEQKNMTDWKLPTSENEVLELMNYIKVFKITDLSFEAKFKLGQKLTENNKENVIKELNKNIRTSELAKYMKQLT